MSWLVSFLCCTIVHLCQMARIFLFSCLYNFIDTLSSTDCAKYSGGWVFFGFFVFGGVVVLFLGGFCFVFWGVFSFVKFLFCLFWLVHSLVGWSFRCCFWCYVLSCYMSSTANYDGNSFGYIYVFFGLFIGIFVKSISCPTHCVYGFGINIVCFRF